MLSKMHAEVKIQTWINMSVTLQNQATTTLWQVKWPVWFQVCVSELILNAGRGTSQFSCLRKNWGPESRFPNVQRDSHWSKPSIITLTLWASVPREDLFNQKHQSQTIWSHHHFPVSSVGFWCWLCSVEPPDVGFKPRTSSLWCDSANHCITVPPPVSHKTIFSPNKCQPQLLFSGNSVLQPCFIGIAFTGTFYTDL